MTAHRFPRLGYYGAIGFVALAFLIVGSTVDRDEERRRVVFFDKRSDSLAVGECHTWSTDGTRCPRQFFEVCRTSDTTWTLALRPAYCYGRSR